MFFFWGIVLVGLLLFFFFLVWVMESFIFFIDEQLEVGDSLMDKVFVVIEVGDFVIVEKYWMELIEKFFQNLVVWSNWGNFWVS